MDAGYMVEPVYEVDDWIARTRFYRARLRILPVPSFVERPIGRTGEGCRRGGTHRRAHGPASVGHPRATAPGRQRAGVSRVLQEILRRPRLPAMLRALGRQ